jgi:uncharacterized RDD family membrane protein YckC
MPSTSFESPKPEKPAGFWIRAAADIVDRVVLVLLSWGVTLGVLGILYFDPLWLQVLNAVTYFCLAFPYYVFCHFRFGSTLGKRWVGIAVVSEKEGGPITLRQSMIRFLGYGLSYAVPASRLLESGLSLAQTGAS